jgi:myo-inositol-1(or 4)-monophosphatase
LPSISEAAGEVDYTPELAAARDIAAEAAAIIRDARVETVREKSRADLVTEVDEAVERLVVSRLAERFPDDPVVGEETSGGAEDRSGRWWAVDPVDGTVNFVHGHPFTCVSIALVVGDRPVVGVVSAPRLGEEFHAAEGAGAWLNDRRISVSHVDDPSAALLATGFPFRKGKGSVEANMTLLGELIVRTHGVRRAGSAALDLCYVAAGRLDAFYEVGLGSWDVAAGLAIVREAGGVVSGMPGDGEPPVHSGRVIASNGRVHHWLESRIEPYLAGLG